ncbi:MAG: hypothetical protein IJB99_09190, partial [Clostridia bacterium]|nr:hypothetical protein [Clostridia bacterium]
MRSQFFSSCTWIYPDMEIEREDTRITLDAPRGGMTAFQILTDVYLEKDEEVALVWENAFSVKPAVYQLLPVCVDQNSGKDVLTGPYEDVKE